MKIGIVTKIDNKNTTTSKLTDDEIVSANYDVIIVSSTDGWFGAIRNPESGDNFYIFINNKLLPHKN